MMCQWSEQVTECELAVSLTSEFEQLTSDFEHHLSNWNVII